MDSLPVMKPVDGGLEVETSACKVCGSERVGGEVLFRREMARKGMAWLSLELLGSEALCLGCYGWMSTIMGAASGDDADAGALGMPVSSDSPVGPGGRCDYCAAELPRYCFAVDLVPDSRRFVRSSLLHHVGQIRQHRVCRQCYAWLRSVLEDSSAMRGASSRQGEGPTGGWLTTIAADAAALFLLRRDEAVLAQTVATMGRSLRRPTVAEAQALGGTDPPVIFVAPNQFGRAAMIAGSLPALARARMVVVARPDSLGDAAEALRRGAGDLLASPLSPQQIAGAMERVLSGVGSERGEAAGLPIYRAPVARPGVACHSVLLRPAAGDDARAVALLARRFLRGYDRIGEDGKGALVALIYCNEPDLTGVLRRMRLLLGERCTLQRAAKAAPLERQQAA